MPKTAQGSPIDARDAMRHLEHLAAGNAFERSCLYCLLGNLEVLHHTVSEKNLTRRSCTWFQAALQSGKQKIGLEEYLE